MITKKSASELILEKHADQPATLGTVMAALDPVVEGHHENRKRITALESGLQHKTAETAVLNIKTSIDSLRMGSMRVTDLPHVSALASAYKEIGVNPLDRIEELNK